MTSSIDHGHPFFRPIFIQTASPKKSLPKRWQSTTFLESAS
jgi:hypothetical protein